MLKREHRLTRHRDFAAVYARKKSWADGRLVLYVLARRPAPTSTPDRPGDFGRTGVVTKKWPGHAQTVVNSETRRFGFSVSKKVGKAHVRNQIKRRLREIVRACRDDWAAENAHGFDAIWVARNPAASATFAELGQSARKLMARGGILTQPSALAGGQETMESRDDRQERNGTTK